jgi:hypothetical protein
MYSENQDHLSFTNVANELPGELIKKLENKYPIIKDEKSKTTNDKNQNLFLELLIKVVGYFKTILQTARQLPLQPIYGFDTLHRIELEGYNKLLLHKSNIEKMLPGIKKSFGLSPIAIIPLNELRRSVADTDELYLFEEVESDGSCFIHPGYYAKLTSFRRSFKGVISKMNAKGWFQNNVVGWKINPKMEDQYDELQLSFIDEYLSYCDRRRGTCSFYNIKDYEQTALQNDFFKRMMKKISEEKPEYRIFSSKIEKVVYSSTEKCNLHFIDAPADAFITMQKIHRLKMKPFIVAEKKSVKIDLKEFDLPKLNVEGTIVSRTVSYDPCPIVGYKRNEGKEEYVIFLKQFGAMDLPIEKEFSDAMKRNYLKKFLGNEHWEN